MYVSCAFDDFVVPYCSNHLLKWCGEPSCLVYAMDGARLELGMVRRHFSSDYFCIASNGWPPAVSKRVQLRVNFAPEVRARQLVVAAARGQNASLECHSESWPAGLHYWTGPTPAAAAARRRHPPEEVLQGSQRLRLRLLPAAAHYRRRMALTLADVGTGDFGVYRCVSENQLGSAHDQIELRDPSSRPPKQYRRRPEPSITTVSDRTIGTGGTSGTSYSTLQELVPFTETEQRAGEPPASAASVSLHIIYMLVLPLVISTLQCQA